MSPDLSEVGDPEGESLRWGWVARSLRTALSLLMVLFVAYAARELWLRWEGGSVRVRIWPIALAVLPLVAGAVLLAWGWTRLIAHIAQRNIHTGQAIALNLQSQLARYMPGKVGVPVVRMAGADRIGVPARTLGSSVFIEVLSSIPVGAVVSVVLLGAVGMPLVRHDMEGMGRWAAGPAALLALGTLLLVVVDRRRFPKVALRLLKLEGQGPLCPIVLPVVHVGYWALWAVHGMLISYAVGASGSLAIASMGLYTLGPVVGFLAVAAPAGIGVREAIVSIGLAAQLGPAPALAAAVLSRGISLLADILAWSVAHLHRRMTQHRI